MLLAFGLAITSATLRAAQAPAADRYAGTWAGTWEGPGTGQFELLLAKGQDGAPTGKVAVTTDNGNYNADLKAVAIDGNKMTAKYDFPLDPSAEVAVTAEFDGERAAKGTWSLRVKADNSEVAAGTFAVTKK
jgi:hypothetical protein